MVDFIDEFLRVIVYSNRTEINRQTSSKLGHNNNSSVISLQMALYKIYSDILCMLNSDFNPIESLSRALVNHVDSNTAKLYFAALQYHSNFEYPINKLKLAEIFQLEIDDSQYSRILSNPVKTFAEFIYLYKHGDKYIRDKNQLRYIANKFAILSESPLGGRLVVTEDYQKTINIVYGDRDSIYTPEYFTGWKGVNFSTREMVINTILNENEKTSIVFNSYDEFSRHYNNIVKRMKIEHEMSIFGTKFNTWKNIADTNEEFREKFAEINPVNKVLLDRYITGEYVPYSPINKSSLITKIDSTFHPSYVELLFTICDEILQHEDVECKSNVEFAKNIMSKIS